MTDAQTRPSHDAFRAAVEAFDVDALLATLAPDVSFRSPAVFKPYEGRDQVAPLLRAVATVLFPTIRYVWQAVDGNREVLGFVAEVGDKEIEGVDILVRGDDGLVRDFTVMIRPLSGLTALRDAIAAELTKAAGGTTP